MASSLQRLRSMLKFYQPWPVGQYLCTTLLVSHLLYLMHYTWTRFYHLICCGDMLNGMHNILTKCNSSHVHWKDICQKHYILSPLAMWPFVIRSTNWQMNQMQKNLRPPPPGIHNITRLVGKYICKEFVSAILPCAKFCQAFCI